MGCVQGKSSRDSELGPGGLERLKVESGYVGRGGSMGPRRSTGQKHTVRETGRVPEPVMNYNVVYGSRGGKKGKIERGRDGGGGVDGEMVDGWPKWLIDNVPKAVLDGLVPKSADSYDKIDKVGQGTYSNVYKARDRDTGKIVALKKVRFDTSEPESVKFMAREITILLKLDHPNVLKLEGLATSRMQYSLYLVFEFMHTDLARIVSRPEGRLTEPQVKCYMHQLLSGLQHCHERGILHRDIKGSNLLIDKNGVLKIGDFGLASFYSPDQKRPLTSRVVTLWYRAPELLLGATNYGVGIDLWSAGCLLAEMFAGRPIMPGRTEVEQLHRIFKLCGTPSEDYWKKLRVSTTFRPPQSYKPRIFEAFGNFPESSLGLLCNFLALDPANRGSASSALQNEFFSTSPLACDLSGLPVIPNKDDEPTEVYEQRKKRRPRMKHRSQTLHERRRKDENGSFKALPEKAVELNIQGLELGSSTSSTSSSTMQRNQVESPAYLHSPIASSRPKMPPRTQGHPNATKNIKNWPSPLPMSSSTNYKDENSNIHRPNQIRRSASSREFRKLDRNKERGTGYI